MKFMHKRIVALLLCLTMLATLVLVVPPMKVEARNYGEYEDVAKVYDQGSCPSMQGMSVHGNYVYACKINGDTETAAVVARAHKDTGSTTFLTNAATGSIYFSDFGHGNDIEVETIAGVTTLFVPTSISGAGGLVRYKLNGTTATKVGSYRFVDKSGSVIGGGALRVTHYDDTNIHFIFKSGKYLCLGTLPISQTSGDIVLTSLCTLDYSSCYVNGTYKDTSNYSLQGMGYYDNKLYLPLSGHTVSGHENISIILVYDLEGASGTIKPDPVLTFQITSSYYGAYFEVESCEISPLDNRLYFSANRRRTNSDTNHDGISYISNWTYDPSSRNSASKNYRWEVIDDQLVSVTDGGNSYNGVHQLQGKIVNGNFTDCRFSLSENVVLTHDRNWILEWKATGADSGALLFATAAESSNKDKPYIFRNGGSLMAIGYSNGSQYNNYGLDLSKHGVDASKTHVYRLFNRVNADGSNMIYLSVDGKELGAMNNYYIAAAAQGTTSDWVSGKDFKFSYLGTPSHRISNCEIEYLQIWGTHLGDSVDEPSTFRWESGMTSVGGHGINLNTATKAAGTTSGINYKDCRYDLAEDVVLMHDRPWVLEWDNAGTWEGSLFLAADHMSNTYHAPYLFRSGSLIAIGYHDGSRHVQWGVKLSSYGIEINDPHIYTLRNLINDDGTNMIWLYVDGVKIAPLTTYCTNGSATSTTSDYLAGKDFTFSYMGTFQHDITGGMAYLQVWEGGKPEEDEPNNYRWETQNDHMINVTDEIFETNALIPLKGSCNDGVYTGTQFMLEKTVTLLHDRHWRLQWEAEGDWSGGGLFLSSNYSSYTANNMYIFRNANVISFGQYTDGSHYQWGVQPSAHGIDHNQKHTYTLINKIKEDGTNMIYLSVDGVEVGPMNTCAKNGGITGDHSDYLSGKDFTFNYIGSREHPVNDTTVSYLQVFEGCEHSYSDWTVTKAATCTADGSKIRTCTICGVKNTDVIAALGHDYSMSTSAGGCEEYAKYHFICRTCGHSYTLDAGELATGWIDYIPAGMDADEFTQKTQYRYSDYETKTSYDADLDGYTVKSGEWEQSGTGSVLYVNTWPSGFSTSNSLYTQYNKKSSKVSNSETATNKTVVSSDKVAGYLYYHWCYSGSVYSKAAQEGSYTTFHAYYSTTAPSSYTCDTSDMSYKTAHSTCSNSAWFFAAEVYQQSYTQYKKLFTYERWTDFSDWTDTALSASDTRKVETRIVYQLKQPSRGGHSYTSKVTAPTCTEGGYTTYTCSACGDTYTDNATAPTGHSFRNTVVDATCTNSGYTVYRCTVCGYSYQSDITISTGHSYITTQVDPTCTTAGYTSYLCSACGYSYMGDRIAALGHSYVSMVTPPTCTLGGYTSYTCFECGDTYVSNQTAAVGHSFKNGICVTCGAADPDYTPASTVPTLTLKAPTLEFKDMICVIAFYTAENTQDVEEMGMITYSSKAATVDITTAEYVIPGAEYDESTGRYYSSSQGIHAKYLADTVYLAVYAKLTDGTYAYSRLAPYSAITYAKSQLKNSTDTKLKQLVVSMLNYGAAAQMYFGHNTENLANAALTQDQLALPESYRADMAQSVPAAQAGKMGIFTNNLGFSSRKPAVSFEGAFSINYFFTPKYTPVDGVTLYYWTEADYNAVSVLTVKNASGVIKMEGSGTGQYRGDIDGISAKNLSQAIFVAAIYSDGDTTWTSGVLGYSIGAYCGSQATKGGTMADLAMATAVYGYHAKQYFG